ncbi:FAD-binding oxidoreductase [Streptosporangium sp. H16]|uniref:FAD-binding oxidoreductase n=1 Tax=Streptosporangium sp. H16 TaxID=3444184 RepID=UPI003F79AE20
MLVDADSDGYAAATRPHNSSIKQRPARVAVVSRPEDIAPALDEVAALARSSGTPLEIVPQATGHGAGAPVGEGAVLLDTSRLTDVSFDPESRVAVVGAGATWSAVNAAAEQHGLLGLAGSAPSVSVSGHTFGGGIGWLVRRDGLASGALRAVRYVDGGGRSRTAADDATDEVDRAAIWAFHGAGESGSLTRWSSTSSQRRTSMPEHCCGMPTRYRNSSKRGRAPSQQSPAAFPPTSRCSTCRLCPRSRRNYTGRSRFISRSPILTGPSRRLRCSTRRGRQRILSLTAGAQPTRRDLLESTSIHPRRPRPSVTRGGSTHRPLSSPKRSSRQPRQTTPRS